jgi:hypothetical protein
MNRMIGRDHVGLGLGIRLGVSCARRSVRERWYDGIIWMSLWISGEDDVDGLGGG